VEPGEKLSIVCPRRNGNRLRIQWFLNRCVDGFRQPERIGPGFLRLRQPDRTSCQQAHEGKEDRLSPARTGEGSRHRMRSWVRLEQSGLPLADGQGGDPKIFLFPEVEGGTADED